MSAGQVSASGGGHTDMSLRPPPQDFQQQQRSREEIELAESLLDHRHGPRDTTRHFSQEQQSQQATQHQTPHQQPAPQQQQQQQQQHYQPSQYSAHDDRRAAQSAEPSRSQQGAEFTPSNHQSLYPIHPHPSTQHQSSPRASTPGSQSVASPSNGQYCSNCGTTKTPLWRRSQLGQTICNACGLYEKARNTARPPNLKRPPSYAPAYSNGPGSEEQDPSNPASTNTYVSAQSQPCQGTCPGDGKCNGTGGTAACHGCPAFNNRVSKTAQLALHHTRRTSPTGEPATVGSMPQDLTPGPDVENVVIACQNCHTTTTPLWRRDMDGHTICNACGLYYKLHGSHRPVEMKKSFIKRRKRVAPALAGQDVQHVSNNAASASEMSTSPEAQSAHIHPGQQHDAWTQRSHARNPIEAQPNIDPSLARNHGPPPVDFTAYNSRPARSAHPPHQHHPQANHSYEPAPHAPPSPISPKRRHQTLSAPDQSALSEPVPGNMRAGPTASPPTNGDGDDGDNNGDDDARRKKRMKREQLKEKLRKMQEEIQALGDSDDDA